MFNSLKPSRLIIIGVSTLLVSGIVFAASFQFSGKSGTIHNYGSFYTNGSGNAGTVSFDSASPCAIPTATLATLDGDRLTGTFCLQTLGKVTFDTNAKISPNVSGKVTDLWTVEGTASSNGGTIYFQSGSYQVHYNPITRTLVHDGWNKGVGKVPFGIYDSTVVVSVDTAIDTDGSVVNTEVSGGFEGGVKILGSIGGNSAFDTFYSLGTKFNASLMADTLNSIRKNVALITRNIPSEFENTFLATTFKKLDNKIIINNKTDNLPTAVKYSDIAFDFSSVDSLIIIGGDLVIDRDIINSDTVSVWNKPKGIIVLKNDKNVGGNIFVQKNVKTIESSMFAEGTLYSSSTMTALNNPDTASTSTLANNAPNQLYIHGALMTRNTIGGAGITGQSICVYGETSCTNTQAVRYDLNYFRGFPGTDPVSGVSLRVPSTRAFRDNTLDNYSMIIELDSRLGANPPPGF